jgi:hypothetical protein
LAVFGSVPTGTSTGLSPSVELSRLSWVLLPPFEMLR